MFHEKIDTIHRLQSMGLSIEQIAQGADMDVKEVKKLLQ
jgi:predicted transposase YdaD